jgi:hypothetical protein
MQGLLSKKLCAMKFPSGNPKWVASGGVLPLSGEEDNDPGEDLASLSRKKV